MKAVKPLDANMVYKRPPGRPDILDLHCTRVRRGVIRTEWRFDPEEVRYLLAGGNIELEILTEPIPPVALNVTAPFCAECAVEMVLEFAGDRELGMPDGPQRLPGHWHFRCPTPACRRWA
jgi:hypothetical protein